MGTPDGEDPPKILVVDDHIDCADTLALVLNYVGYSARGAYSAAEALRIAREWTPWAALLDLAMPITNGLVLAVELKEACKPAPLLLAVTGLQGPEVKKRCDDAGFARVFLKPCDPRDVVAELDRLRPKVASALQ